MIIGPEKDHRDREKGLLVYPVISRRSGGLSIGINLFPDTKVCSFDCPYCEVFPFTARQGFSLPLMEADLMKSLFRAGKQEIPVRDICFSGNGEPSVSPHFSSALRAAFCIRDREVPDAELVLITNGTGLIEDEIFEQLRQAALKDKGLCIWLKLDAGTPGWYKTINRSSISYGAMIEKIKAFAVCAPLTLQTMICSINNLAPSPEEGQAWEALVLDLASSAMELRGVQIYGKARPAPEDPYASALPINFLEARAASLRAVFDSAGINVPVMVYP